MKRGTARHHKIDELADALDIERPHALGLIASLWDWTAETCPAGDIGKATNRTIASRSEWRGDPDVFIAALIKARLVDEHPTSRLVIHDWSEHCDDGVHTYMARRRFLFADGTTPRLRHLHSKEREAAEKEYSAILAQKPTPQPIVEPATIVPRNFQGQNVVGTVRNDTDRIGTDRHVPPPPPSVAIQIPEQDDQQGENFVVAEIQQATHRQLGSRDRMALTEICAEIEKAPEPVIEGIARSWPQVYARAVTFALTQTQNPAPIPLAGWARTAAMNCINTHQWPGIAITPTKIGPPKKSREEIAAQDAAILALSAPRKRA